jgi:acetoin utilization protein AcuC
MDTCLVYTPALAAYDLGPEHPLRPERYVLAVELLEAYGLVPDGTASGTPGAGPVGVGPVALDVLEPQPAPDADILLVHSEPLVYAVRRAGSGSHWPMLHRYGIGGMDTPSFRGMHDAGALVAGATSLALDQVLSGAYRSAVSLGGGLHHAHRDRVAGFCVYNDAAVAISRALRTYPDLRVAYVDIDAHHGDGVQEAFYDDPRVLTVSVHETGFALYPGTGFPDERGEGAGLGYAANLPLPPLATDACYRIAFEEGIAPIVRTFAPDVMVAQCGADSHHDDPLTMLGLTVGGHDWLTRSLVALAAEVCAGRIVVLGGGGYAWEHVVPRLWALATANAARVTLPDEVPERWRARVRDAAGTEPPRELRADAFDVGPLVEERLEAETRAAVSALLDGPLPETR